MDPQPFIRGCAFNGTKHVPYPRADPTDRRIPRDTWQTAQLPVGVRLELVGDAEAVDIAYVTATDDLGYRGEGAGRTFSLWRGGTLVDEEKADLGDGRVRLALGGRPGDERAVVYLPEGMKPTLKSLSGVGGRVEPAPADQPRWIAYGDSVAEGWVASGPALAWPAIAGRTFGLDTVNMGYAGAARGEVASAEQVAALDADVISITHGTNCWTLTPHSVDMMRAAVAAFLDVVREGHPETPIVVASPVLRPDAETTPNRFGATLVDLRRAMEQAAGERDVVLVPGGDLLGPERLSDGIHPDDEGHRILAEVIGTQVAKSVQADAS
ncbi:MAG: lipolytic protein family [Acidimicrobiales bacterium]|nr:lipolytic protein family [Acidimicrobiales bacterium]